MKKVSLFFLSVFSSSVVAINAFGMQSIVTFGKAKRFYELSTGKTAKTFKELRDCGSEESNTPGIPDPQIFRFDDYVVKISTKRAPTEIEGTRKTLNHLKDKMDLIHPNGEIVFHNFSICVTSKVAIFEEGQEPIPRDISEFDICTIRGRPVLQLMPMAREITLDDFLTHKSSTCPESVRESVFSQLGSAIANMNILGLHNNDLHEANSIVDLSTWHVSFIDFEKAKCSLGIGNPGFLADCNTTFCRVFYLHFFCPVLNDPASFDRKNNEIGKGVKAFLRSYHEVVPEVSLDDLIDDLGFMLEFDDYFEQEENNQYKNNEEFVDQRMLAACRILAEFHEYAPKRNTTPLILPGLIKKLVTKKRYDKSKLSYYSKITDLLGAMFFKFTTEDIYGFLDTLGISKEKEWVRYIPTIMGASTETTELMRGTCV